MAFLMRHVNFIKRGVKWGWVGAGVVSKGSKRGSGFLLMSAFNSDRLSLLLSISLPLHLLASSADQGRSRSISSEGGPGVRHGCVDVSAPPAPSEMRGVGSGGGVAEEERKQEDVKATATADPPTPLSPLKMDLHNGLMFGAPCVADRSVRVCLCASQSLSVYLRKQIKLSSLSKAFILKWLQFGNENKTD